MNKKMIDELSAMITAMYRDLNNFDNRFKSYSECYPESYFSKAFLISARSVIENSVSFLMKKEITDGELEMVIDALNRLCVLLLEKEFEIK